jgi:capsular polysaccharide biosynthesis protein
MDIVSKFRLIEKRWSTNFEKYIFILANPSKYFEAICKEFFPDLEYRVMPKNETWRFAHLVVPSLSNHRDGILTPHMPPWIRYLANLIVGEDIKPSRKIFITRKDAMNRNIKNQNELLMALKGWETVTLENLSIKDQVKTFAEATHIVSPHGAGLTNLLWCRPKTKVYELTHKAFIGKIVYPSLSHHLELKHHVILCDTEKISGQKPRNKKQKDMVNLKINVKDFISYID